jgi:hypothetical protein
VHCHRNPCHRNPRDIVVPGTRSTQPGQVSSFPSTPAPTWLVSHEPEPIFVRAPRLPASPRRSGHLYIGQTPLQQQQSCSRNSTTRKTLADPSVRRSIGQALSNSRSRSGQWEYGFWVTSPNSGDNTVWSVGTTRDPWEINPGKLSPYGFGINWSFLFGSSKPNVLVHTHIPDSPISQEDVDYARERSVSIIAVTDQWRNYCYP